MSLSLRTYTYFNRWIAFSFFVCRRCFVNAFPKGKKGKDKRDLVRTFITVSYYCSTKLSGHFGAKRSSGTRSSLMLSFRQHAHTHSFCPLVHCTTKEAGKAQCMYIYACTAPKTFWSETTTVTRGTRCLDVDVI